MSVFGGTVAQRHQVRGMIDEYLCQQLCHRPHCARHSRINAVLFVLTAESLTRRLKGLA